MTGADMGMMPMVSPARRRMARALTQPAAGMPTMMPQAPALRMAADPGAGGGMAYASPGSGEGGNIADTRGQGKDQATAATLGDFARSAAMGLGGVFGGPLGMAGLGPSIAAGTPTGIGSAIMDMIGGGRSAPGGGLGVGGIADDLAAFGGSPPAPGVDLSDAGLDAAGAAGAAADPNAGGMAQGANGEGVDPGGFFGGGFVMPGDLGGPDPAGPDQGYGALQIGEVVLNKDQQKRLGRDKIARALMGRR